MFQHASSCFIIHGAEISCVNLVGNYELLLAIGPEKWACLNSGLIRDIRASSQQIPNFRCRVSLFVAGFKPMHALLNNWNHWNTVYHSFMIWISNSIQKDPGSSWCIIIWSTSSHSEGRVSCVVDPNAASPPYGHAATGRGEGNGAAAVGHERGRRDWWHATLEVPWVNF